MADDTEIEDVREEDSYELDNRTVDAIVDAAEAGDAKLLTELMEPLHAADIADLLEQVSSDERLDILRHYENEIDGEILSEIDESIREEVIAALSPEVLSDAVRELDCDDVVDIIEDLEEQQQEAILAALDDGRPGRGRTGAGLSGIFRRASDAARGRGGPRTLDGGRGHRLSARDRGSAGRILSHDPGRSARCIRWAM